MYPKINRKISDSLKIIQKKLNENKTLAKIWRETPNVITKQC